MGDRAQVKVTQRKSEPAVFLYTHWDGASLVDTVRAALAKHWRWTDGEYLTRIIFCQMVKGREAEETGFGIGVAMHGDLDNPLVGVDVPSQTVTVGDKTGTFSQFVQKDGPFA